MSKLKKAIIAITFLAFVISSSLLIWSINKSAQNVYVGIVLSEQTADQTFATSTMATISEWNKQNGNILSPTIYSPENKTNMEDQFMTAVSNNDIIITINTYDQYVETYAQTYPEKDFIVFNGSVQGYTNVTNIYMNFSTDSYLLGAYSASSSKDGVVYIGEPSTSEALNQKTFYPFVAGVYDTDPDAELNYMAYTNTLDASQKEEMIKKALNAGNVIVIGATDYTEEILTIANEIGYASDTIFVTMSGIDYSLSGNYTNIGASQIFDYNETLSNAFDNIIYGTNNMQYANYPKYYILDETTARLLNTITNDVFIGITTFPSNEKEFKEYTAKHKAINIIK